MVEAFWFYSFVLNPAVFGLDFLSCVGFGPGQHASDVVVGRFLCISLVGFALNVISGGLLIWGAYSTRKNLQA